MRSDPARLRCQSKNPIRLLGLYRDNGKESGNYYLGFRVSGLIEYAHDSCGVSLNVYDSSQDKQIQNINAVPAILHPMGWHFPLRGGGQLLGASH